MKKTLLAAAILIAMVFLVVAAYADGPTSGFLASVTVTKHGKNVRPIQGYGGDIFDLGTLNNWDLWYSGSATISPTSAPATLAGGFDTKLWQFEYSVSGNENDWSTIGDLISGWTAAPQSTDPDNYARTEQATAKSVYARYLRIRYNPTLDSAANASASGSASMDAVSAVPEPGTILAACSILAPAGMLFRRKKKK